MSRQIAEAIRAIQNAGTPDIYNGHKEAIDRVIRNLQEECFHRVTPIENDPDGFRYECQDCGKKLKILSGMILNNGSAESDE